MLLECIKKVFVFLAAQFFFSEEDPKTNIEHFYRHFFLRVSIMDEVKELEGEDVELLQKKLAQGGCNQFKGCKNFPVFDFFSGGSGNTARLQ